MITIHSASFSAVRRLNDLSPERVTTFPENPKDCDFTDLHPNNAKKTSCQNEISGMITEINSVAKFEKLHEVKRFFGYQITINFWKFESNLGTHVEQAHMPSLVKHYISISSSGDLNGENLECFIDKLIEMYNKNGSIEDLAAAVSKLLKRINENSVSTSLPELY